MKYISPCLLFFGVLTLGAAVFIGYYVVPYKVWENVMDQSKIVEGNTRFNNWEVIPVPLFQRIYFFNVTNPYEVINLGGKPILQEIGPYVYQQKKRKFDIVFNDNGTIFYREKTHYFFRPDLSNGSESDWITFVNLPYVGAANKALDLDSFTRYLISDTVNNYPEEGLYMNITVEKLIFEGKYLPFMKELAEFKGEEILPNSTFGLYYGRNGTDLGRFEIYSGVQHPDRFGNVISWNGNQELDWWNDSYCNQINGSDGGIFRPYATKQRTFIMFIPGLCRSFRFTFESEEKVSEIPVYKYSIPASFFESAKTNKDNACYCSNPGKDYENCPEDGVLQLAACNKGAMVLSQPHFYQGSDTYLNQSSGLQPLKERHEMALYIEPYTSVPAIVKMRFQMNVDLKPNKYFRPLRKIPRMIHPLFWIDSSVQIPEESIAIIKDKLYGTVNIANLLTHIGIIAGFVMIVISLLTFFLCPPQYKNDEEKIECVSYEPRETVSSEKLELNRICNGKIKSHHILNETKFTGESIPFLHQNGKHPQLNDDSCTNETEEAKSEQLGVLPEEQLSTTILKNGANSSNGESSHPINQAQEIKSPSLVDVNKRPDSKLSAFPAATDYSSSLSITDTINTLKDITEAMSSYENL